MKPVLYELVVRLFGNLVADPVPDGTRERNGCGTFADINDAALASLRTLGVTHLWLAGVPRQATTTDHPAVGLPPDDPDVVKGLAGSFYAVRDVFDVCPDYARDPARRREEFAALVARAHAAGLKVLVDFVGNHVARGHATVVSPEWELGAADDRAYFFARDNAFFWLADPPGQALRLSRPPHWNPPLAFDGRFPPEDGAPGRPPRASANNVTDPQPASTDWYEAVKLNWGFDFTTGRTHYDPPPRTWHIMDRVLAHWQAMGVDGFRCDFAHYVPAEAWTFLIAGARRRDPGAFFVAEAYPYEGSGDPVTDKGQLVSAGFDAIYHSASYDALKRLYQGAAPIGHWFDHAPAAARDVAYLENHDERRVASPVVRGTAPGHSGFGAAAANYQLAPFQFLAGPGPVLLLNGQEVGEPGAGAQGFSQEDGRTTIFDYSSMPAFLGWVAGHAYDGSGLAPAAAALRGFFARLLALCADPAAGGAGWAAIDGLPGGVAGFGRFVPGSGRLLAVIGNFRAGGAAEGTVRIAPGLAAAAGLGEALRVRVALHRDPAAEGNRPGTTREALAREGVAFSLPDQSSLVLAVEPG